MSMNTSFAILLALAATLAACSAQRAQRGDPDTAETERPAAPGSPDAGTAEASILPPGPVRQELLDMVAGLPGLDSWTVIPLAHFQRESRHVIVIWPAINSAGELVDATVVGVPLEAAETGGLQEAGRRWVIRDVATSQAALVAALGGEDYELRDRRAGVPLEELGPRLSSYGRSFAEAVRRHDSPRAAAAAVAFSLLLPVERAAHEPAVAQLLWLAAAQSASLEHVSTDREGDSAQLRMRLRRGRMVLRTLELTAGPAEGGDDRWVVVSYR